MSHIREHNERYEALDVFATSEVADNSDSIQSTGMSNANLTDDVSIVVSGLAEVGESNNVLNSMALAGVVALARHSRVLLKGGNMSQEDKRRVLESGAVSAGAAGVVSPGSRTRPDWMHGNGRAGAQQQRQPDGIAGGALKPSGQS